MVYFTINESTNHLCTLKYIYNHLLIPAIILAVNYGEVIVD